MLSKAFSTATVITASLVISAANSAFAQSQFPNQWAQNASRILSSKTAKYLSGSGLNALNIISGNVQISGNIQTANTTGFGQSFMSDRSGVMVNDPARDVFTFFDISSQSETNVAAFGKTVVVAYNDSTGFAGNGPPSGQAYSLSNDGGESFTEIGDFPVSPTGFNFGDPGLAVNLNGIFYQSHIAADTTLDPNFSQVGGLAKSTDGGATFGLPIYTPPPPGANTTILSAFADKPFITVDDSGSAYAGTVYLTYTSFELSSSFVSSMVIRLSKSSDGGTTLSVPVAISSADNFSSGSQPAVGPSGELYVAWFNFGPGPSGVMVVKSVDGGATFNSPVLVAQATPAGFNSGNMTGNFRVNSFPRIDVDPANGNVYIVYGARPNTPGDSGDVFFIRSTDGGGSWSAPLRINTDPGTNDQFFPAVAVDGNGLLRIVWYDKRNDPENLRIGVYTVASHDGGVSFSENHRVINETFDPAVGYDPILNPVYMGDYIDIKAGLKASGRTDTLNFAWTDCRRIITTSGGTRPDQDVFFTRFGR